MEKPKAWWAERSSACAIAARMEPPCATATTSSARVPVGEPLDQRPDAGAHLGEAFAAGRLLLGAVRPEGMRRVAQPLGQRLVRQALPLAQVLLGEVGFLREFGFPVAGGEDGGGGGAGARQAGHDPVRRLRQAEGEPAVQRRFLAQGGVAKGDVHGAVEHGAGGGLDQGVADEEEAGDGGDRLLHGARACRSAEAAASAPLGGRGTRFKRLRARGPGRRGVGRGFGIRQSGNGLLPAGAGGGGGGSGARRSLPELPPSSPRRRTSSSCTANSSGAPKLSAPLSRMKVSPSISRLPPVRFPACLATRRAESAGIEPRRPRARAPRRPRLPSVAVVTRRTEQAASGA